MKISFESCKHYDKMNISSSLGWWASNQYYAFKIVPPLVSSKLYTKAVKVFFI